MTTGDRLLPVVDVAGLSIGLGGRPVVHDVTLTVRPGDLLALTGANGGGKTTTLRMLAGLLRPDSGSGTVLGRDVMRPKRADRADLGYMTQKLSLYPELSVIENLRFRAAIHRLSDPAEAIEAVIGTYGLGPYVQARIDTLSGGWARRAQFAATMIHAPRLLLLDEPTAGLDATTRQDIWNRLHALGAQGQAIVVSTHDHAEAATCSWQLHYEPGPHGSTAVCLP